jgi:hypothetical protein
MTTNITKMPTKAPVSGIILTANDQENIERIMQTQQLEMATNLLKVLKDTYGVKGISALDLLDALGICGLSLIIGEWASYTYLTELNKLDDFGSPVSGDK